MRRRNDPKAKMQAHVLYWLLAADPGAWANTPIGRLPAAHGGVVRQVTRRGSLQEAPPGAPERVETLDVLELAA